MTKVAGPVAAGAIGKVVQTVRLDPLRHNPRLRPAWFYDRAATGGIPCDIGSRRIGRLPFFAGLDNAEIVSGCIDNQGNPHHPDFDDFGEILLRGRDARGYARLDWFTPDAPPTSGDGRLVILGSDGGVPYIARLATERAIEAQRVAERSRRLRRPASS